MRKVLLVSLSVLIVVLSAGYCIAWYAQASQIKKSIEQAVAQFNAQQKTITYDALETSGFPSDIYVSIINPHFSGRVDPLLKALTAKAHPNQPNLAASIPQWDDDVKLNGKIIVGINALSDHYSLRIAGNWQRTSTIGGQKTSIASQSAGDTLCLLQTKHSGIALGMLWDFQALRQSGKDFLRDLRLLDCSGYSTTISDAVTHMPLITNGPWRFYISSAPKDTQQNVRLYAKFADMQVTPQGDAMITLQRNAVMPAPYPIQYSIFGKQNLEFDLSYAGPSDLKAADNNPQLDIALSKFNISNQMYTSNMAFFLNNSTVNANRTARLVFKADENFSEPYDNVAQEALHGFVTQLYAGGEAKPALPLQPWLQKYTPDQMYAILASALPNFHSLGHAVQSLDVGYQGAPDLANGNITLSDIELSTSTYGIKGSGTAKRVPGQPLPDGHVVLTCSNCARLVDDTIAYITRLKNAISYFQTPEQLAANTPISPQLADSIKNFLKALSIPAKDADPDKNSFTYVIASDMTAGVSVNGKRLTDLFAMYNEYIVPALKPQPATVTNAPASSPAPAAIVPAR